MIKQQEQLERINKWTPSMKLDSSNLTEKLNTYDQIDGRIIRKLGALELVYDHELQLKGIILPFSVVFESKLDLFQHKDKIKNAIKVWKNVHPLLCARILTLPDSKHKLSREKYFVYASKEKITSHDNVKFVEDVDWKKYHERELNSDPVDSKNGLLWRLMFIKLENNKFCMLFTVHHSIVDGRNISVILQQLLNLIEKSIKREKLNYQVVPVCCSIEEKLFKNDEKEIQTLRFNPNFMIPQEDRVLKEMKQTDPESGIKCKYFKIQKNKFRKLYQTAKSKGTKLAGCLNIVTAIAFLELYKEFGQNHIDKIYFAMMANMRQFLSMDNLTMGTWPVVMNGIFDSVDLANRTIDKEFLKENFWKFAKNESDSIHKRIDQNELYENAKLSSLLLDLIEDDVTFENGGAHFSISNVGKVEMYEFELFKLKEMYFNISCLEKRFTGPNFHGICTIDDTLCWSISYNTKLYDDFIFDNLIEKIIFIIDTVIN